MAKIGTDIISFSRLKDIPETQMREIFSASEISYATKFSCCEERFGGFYASKEAFLKALGTGIVSKDSLKDISVEHNSNGKPYFLFFGEYKKYNECKIELSISHDGGYAVAFVLIEE